MDYGDIFRRSWNIIWKNKFMLFLGFLAALGSGGSYNGSGGNSGSNFNFGSGDFPEGMPFDPNLIEQFGSRMQEFWIAFGVLILGLICVAFIVGIILWLVRLTAQAGMIDAASRLDAGEEVTFGAAISAGWRRLMGMVGLDLVIAAIFIVFGIVMALFWLSASIYATDARRELVLEYLEVSKCEESVGSSIDTFVQQFSQQNPNADVTKFREYMYETMGWETLREPLIRIVMKYFSDQELRDVIAFYQTPSGKAVAEKSPQMNIEMSEVISANIINAIQSRTQK